MRLAVGRLGVVRMGMWGSVGEAVGGRRVGWRLRAVKRGRRAVRMQSVDQCQCFDGYCWFDQGVGGGAIGERGGGTVHGFALHVEDTVVFGDEVVEFAVGEFDGADLILFVDVVAVIDMLVSVEGPIGGGRTQASPDHVGIRDLWEGCSMSGGTW